MATAAHGSTHSRMRVRNVIPGDLPKLKALFLRQGFDYQFPDLSSDQFLVKQVVVDEDDNPVNAICARQTVELFMLADPEWRTPRWRMEALKLIHATMRTALAGIGVEDAHVWLPPQVCKSFGRRLVRDFGWVKNIWPVYCRGTRA